MLSKMIIRDISKSKAKFFAIMAIVALGVGFFAGLDAAEPAMMETGNEYLENHKFYDFQLISNVGWDQSDVDSLKQEDFVTTVEGSKTTDIVVGDKEKSKVFKVHSLPKDINTLEVKKGRLPKKPGECIVDSQSGLKMGKTLTLSDENSSNVEDSFKNHQWKIVGICSSPIYMNLERGTTSLGSGSVSGFVYVPLKEFKTDTFSEIYIRTKGTHSIHTAAYKKKIKEQKPKITSKSTDLANKRLNQLQQAQMAMLASAGMPKIADMDFPQKAESYILTRNENAGYMCFDNDTGIVKSIAKVFPIFFILIVALVTITTMTRIIEEQRSDQGTLKALGYTNKDLLRMYNTYSLSATLTGTVIGYFVGTLAVPQLVWHSYTSVYDFSKYSNVVFNWKSGIYSLIVATAISYLTTWIAAKPNLKEVPAELIRPLEGKKGKPILLEKIKPLWKKIPLLYRISLRNTFRYKKRFFMMILGISGCTALLVTGFGVSDSIDSIVKSQYDDIFKFQYEVALKAPLDEKGKETFIKEFSKDDQLLFVDRKTVKIKAKGKSKNINMIISDGDDFSKFINLKNGKKTTTFPSEGNTVITKRYATDLGLKKGSPVTFITDDYKKIHCKLSGVAENYIDKYAYISDSTLKEATGQDTSFSTVLVKSKNKDISKQVNKLRDNRNVLSVSTSSDFRSRINTMIDSLSTVILLVVISSGLLAFIVLYNLTNINLTERIREIATIKVLGFYPKETASYIFRENLFITGLSAIVGSFLGKFLHRFVISKIQVDMIAFKCVIKPTSYIYSIALTFLFGFIVMFLMYFKLKKISMTESLKSVE